MFRIIMVVLALMFAASAGYMANHIHMLYDLGQLKGSEYVVGVAFVVYMLLCCILALYTAAKGKE